MARDYTLQALRATTVARLADTPVDGEIVIDTDLRTAGQPFVFVGDGATAGGVLNPDAAVTGFLRDDADDTTTANILTQQPAAGHASYQMIGDSAAIYLKDDNAAAGKQAFRIINSSGTIFINSLNDDFSLKGVDELELRVTHGGGFRIGEPLVGDLGYGSVNAEGLYIHGYPVSTAAGLSGLNVLEGTVGTSTNSIRVGAGSCSDLTTRESIVLPALLSKRIDAAWAAGTGNGAILGGTTIAANSRATVWVIKDTPNNIVDIGVHTSADRATVLGALPAGYDSLQYLGAILSTAAGTHDPFLSLGSNFFLRAPKLVYNTVAIADDVWTTVTLPMPGNVIGLMTLELIGSATADAIMALYLTWPGADVATAPTAEDSAVVVFRGATVSNQPIAQRTEGFIDINSRVSWAVSFSAQFTPASYNIYCHGWFDPLRGNV